MADIRDCIGIINEVVGDAMDMASKEKLLNKISNKIKKEKGTLKEQELEDNIKKWLSDSSTKEEIAAAVEARSQLLNVQAWERVTSHMSNFQDRVLGVRALIGGTMQQLTGARRSIDATGKARGMNMNLKMIRHLEEESVFEEFVSGKIDDAIAQEMWEFRQGGKSGVSGNKSAEKIARIVMQVQDESIDGLNRWGAWIRKLPDYITRQSHDPRKIRRSGFDKWFAFIQEVIDMDRTMAEVDFDQQGSFWRSVYDGLISGIHLKQGTPDFADDIAKGFTGSKNLAKSVSTKHRILHFKDSAAFMKYNREYGTKTLRESIVQSLEYQGRQQALMEFLGTNPENMLVRIIKQEIRSAKKSGNTEAAQKFSAMLDQNGNLNPWNYTTWLYREVDGSTRIPGNVTASFWSSTVRNIQNMAKLGMATISSFTDIPNQVAELKYQGVNRFEGYTVAFENLFKGRGKLKSERREVAQMLGVGFDGMIGSTISRFSADDALPGMFAKAQMAYFKLNLLSPWTDSHRVGASIMMAKHLANQAGKDFVNLDTPTQRIMEMFDIGELEWNHIVRKAVFKGKEGGKFITTDMLEALDDKVFLDYLKLKQPIIKKHSKAKIGRTRDKLKGQLMAYYADRADFAVPMPGATERAFMNMGAPDGTALGVTSRLFYQFKSFPITVIHKSLGREIYGYGASSLKEGLVKGKASYTALAHFVVSTSLLGYLSLYMKDILRGKEPRKFTNDMAHNIKVIQAAMAQGGGLGIYGDFLFGNFNRYGSSLTNTLLGPTFGQIDKIGQIWSAAKTGDDPFAKMANLIQGNTPFINLFYLRMVLDYLILYNIKEWQSPGYLRRMERRLKKDHNQRFYIPPSRVIKRGGDVNPINILEKMYEQGTK